MHSSTRASCREMNNNSVKKMALHQVLFSVLQAGQEAAIYIAMLCKVYLLLKWIDSVLRLAVSS